MQYLWGSSEAEPVTIESLATPKEVEDFLRLADECKTRTLTDAEATEDWVRVEIEQSDITLLEKEVPEGTCIKAFCIIDDCTPQQLLDLNLDADLENRQKWDTELLKLDIVKEVSETCQVTVTHFAAPYPVSTREFVDCRRWWHEDDGTIVFVSQSINYDAVPLGQDCVRGVSFNGIIMKPIQDGSAIDLTFITSVNPMGWIPAMVVNMFKHKVAERMELFRRLAKEAKEAQ